MTDRDAIISGDFRQLLADVYEEKRMKRPGYSFRAYARFLEVDPSTLRKLISGERPLGVTLIAKLGQKLELPQRQLDGYLQSRGRRKELGTLASDSIKPVYQTLNESLLRAMPTWQSYAILELMDIDGFQPNSAWIAGALRLDVEEIEIALRDLQRIHWLTIEPSGGWIKNPNPTTADPKDPQTAELRRLLMKNILEKAVDSFSTVPRERRTFQAQTFAIDDSLMAEAVEKIRVFRTEMNHLMQSAPKKRGGKMNQVYGLLVGLYPLSHSDCGTDCR